MTDTDRLSAWQAYAVSRAIWRHWRKSYAGGLDWATMRVLEPRATAMYANCLRILEGN